MQHLRSGQNKWNRYRSIEVGTGASYPVESSVRGWEGGRGSLAKMYLDFQYLHEVFIGARLAVYLFF